MHKYTNECVCIKLYNKYIPSRNKVLNCDYMVFGHYDGISIDINVSEENDDIVNVWYHMLEQVKLEEDESIFSKQLIYAFREISHEDEYQTSKVFWGDSELPYLFLSIMQLSKVNDYNCLRRHIENIIKDDYCQKYKIHINNIDKNIRVITYNTFENNSLLIAIKSKNFINGETIINSMHEKDTIIQYSSDSFVKIYNTYTLNAINNKILNNGMYNKLTDKVKNVYMFIIEKYPGSIGRLKKEIENRLNDSSIKVERYMLSGNDDECLVIKEITWNKLLKLYAPYNDEPGLLTSGNALFFETTYSLATHFLIKPSIRRIFSCNEDSYKNMDRDIRLSKEIYSYVDKISEYLYDKEGNIQYITATYYKAIRKAINALQKFEISRFPDYMFFWIFKPLKLMAMAIMFYSCLERNLISNNKCEMDYLRACLSHESIFNFLNGIVLISQNSMHADRQFMQVPDFNAKLYDVPVKLNALYGTIVNNVCKILNSSECEYSFLLVPGLNEYLVVRTVFDSLIQSKRLFTIEIPERQMFEIQYTIPTLIHEIAHKVGGNVRRREDRYNKILNIIVSILTFDILKMYGIEAKNDSVFNSMYPVIQTKFVQCLVETQRINDKIHSENKNIFDSISQDEIPEFNIIFSERKKERLDLLQEDILYAMNRFIEDVINDNDFLGCLWRQKLIYDNKEFVNMRFVNEKFARVLSIYNKEEIIKLSDESTLLGFNVSLNAVFHLFSEVYADYVSIFLLHLSEETYFEAVKKNLVAPNQNKLHTSIAVLRFAMIEDFMIEEVNKDYKWTGEYITSKQDDKILRETAKTIVGLVTRWKYPHRNYLPLYIDNIHEMLFSPQIYKLYKEYITECSSQLKVCVEYKKDCVQKLRDMYSSLNGKNYSIEKLIGSIELSSQHYKNSIYEINNDQ